MSTTAKVSQSASLTFRSPLWSAPSSSAATCAEMYYPPYMWAKRPQIRQISAERRVDGTPVLPYGRKVDITATGHQGGKLRAALIRLGSTTHGNDMDQRYIWLTKPAPPSTDRETTLTITLPTNPATAPPGDYQLVIVRDNVPSTGYIVRVQTA
ncbi:galactose oxidase early set domain-containing protein [Streptomyces sp. S1A(2023)]